MITLTKDKYLSQEETQELIRVLKLISPNNERDGLMVELALKSGARQGEIIKIESKDLDAHNMTVFISHPEKGSSKREVPLDREFFNRLYSYSKKVNGKLFPISAVRVRQIWGEIRPYPKKFHALRHTFGRAQFKTTNNIVLVQYLLGHKSISSTGIYTMVDFESDSLRKAMGL